MIRLIALEIAVPERPWPILGLLGEAEIPSIRERIYKFRLAHLVEGSFSPASSILTQLAKGQKDNRLHHSPANIHWSEDKDIIYYTGLPVVLSKIGAMGRSMTQELMQLIDLLAFKQELPTVELSKVVDSVVWTQQFRRSNYNFIKHGDNQHLDVKYSYNLAQARIATGDLQMLKQTIKHLGIQLTIIQWRYIAIGIAVEWLTKASKTWDQDEDGEEDDFAEGDDEEEFSANIINNIIVQQASHSQRVAQNHYTINRAFLNRLGPQLISAFEQASIAQYNQFEWKSEGSRQKGKHR